MCHDYVGMLYRSLAKVCSFHRPTQAVAVYSKLCHPMDNM